MTCPACDAAFRASGTHISFCAACGHRWLVTSEKERNSVEAGTYTRDYAGYRPDLKFIETASAVTAAELVTRVPPPGRLLDVGCGAGEFMSIAKDAGYSVEGIDISAASAEICRERGFNARAGNFLTEDFDSKYDLITMWDVVEHLRDPHAFLERARSLLSERGWVFAKIPGFGDLSVGLSSRLPRVAGTLLGAPSHVQFFDRESLSRLLARSGFEAQWINGGKARSEATGGPIRRRMARRARSVVKRWSGDANLYVVARPAT